MVWFSSQISITSNFKTTNTCTCFLTHSKPQRDLPNIFSILNFVAFYQQYASIGIWCIIAARFIRYTRAFNEMTEHFDHIWKKNVMPTDVDCMIAQRHGAKNFGNTWYLITMYFMSFTLYSLNIVCKLDFFFILFRCCLSDLDIWCWCQVYFFLFFYRI